MANSFKNSNQNSYQGCSDEELNNLFYEAFPLEARKPQHNVAIARTIIEGAD